jgi:hypothetical protein
VTTLATPSTRAARHRVAVWLAQHAHHVALVALAAPLAIGLLGVLGDDWRPTGDYAHTAMAVRDVPEHLPLIGVAGRFGPFDNQHAHPGPAMAYALWPVTSALGGSGTALLAATTLLHLGALAAAVLVARRVGGRSYAVAIGAVGVVLVGALGAQFFLTPWNPWIPVLAFFCFLVLIHATVSGHLAAAPWAVAVGTLCAQTHVSYMVLVHGLLAAALVAVLFATWRGRASHRWKQLARPLALSAAVAVLMWLPPLWDQLRGTGNLGWLIGRFTHPCDPRWWADECAQPVGARAAARALAAELNLGGAWISGARHDPATVTPNLVGLALAVIAVAAAVAMTVRRRDRRAAWGLAVAGAAVLLGWLSAARILGDFYDYVIRWSWPIAAYGFAVTVWALWRAIPDRAVLVRRVLAALALAVLAVAVGRAVVHAATVEPPYQADSRSVAALAAAARPQLDADDRHLLRWHDPAGLGGVGFGLLLELERAGLSIGTDWWTRFAVGEHRVLAEDHASSVLWVVVGEPSIERFSQRADAVELARFDPRRADERARSELARQRIEQGLDQLGRTDLLEVLDRQFGNAALIAAAPELPDELDREISIYTDLRLPVALFRVPPGAPIFELP